MNNYLEVVRRMKDAYLNLMHAFPDHGLVGLISFASSGGLILSDEFWERYSEKDHPTQISAFRQYVSDLETEIA